MECTHCGNLKYVKNGTYKGVCVIVAKLVFFILVIKSVNLIMDCLFTAAK